MAARALPQGGLDYLTEQEADTVRDAQQIDWRVKVFMKIAERRLMLAENPQATQSERDEKNWGSLPQGSRAQMLKHYQRAIEETIINFEDAYDRDSKDKNLLKALGLFRDATAQHLQRLEALRSTISDDATRQLLEQTLDDLRLAYDDAGQSEKEFQAAFEQDEREKKEKKKRRP